MSDTQIRPIEALSHEELVAEVKRLRENQSASAGEPKWCDHCGGKLSGKRQPPISPSSDEAAHEGDSEK